MDFLRSMVFQLEYFFESAMDYLTRQYVDKPSDLPELHLPAEKMAEIQYGESMAAWAVEEYCGPVDGRTVI